MSSPMNTSGGAGYQADLVTSWIEQQTATTTAQRVRAYAPIVFALKPEQLPLGRLGHRNAIDMTTWSSLHGGSDQMLHYLIEVKGHPVHEPWKVVWVMLFTRADRKHGEPICREAIKYKVLDLTEAYMVGGFRGVREECHVLAEVVDLLGDREERLLCRAFDRTRGKFQRILMSEMGRDFCYVQINLDVGVIHPIPLGRRVPLDLTGRRSHQVDVSGKFPTADEMRDFVPLTGISPWDLASMFRFNIKVYHQEFFAQLRYFTRWYIDRPGLVFLK